MSLPRRLCLCMFSAPDTGENFTALKKLNIKQCINGPLSVRRLKWCIFESIIWRNLQFEYNVCFNCTYMYRYCGVVPWYETINIRIRFAKLFFLWLTSVCNIILTIWLNILTLSLFWFDILTVSYRDIWVWIDCLKFVQNSLVSKIMNR